MQEFSSVTASSYDADSLAPLLTEKSAEGWSVVSIVSAGTNIVAYLERESDGTTAEAAPVIEDATDIIPDSDTTPTGAESPYAPGAAAVATAAGAADTTPAPEVAPVDEPSGWAAAPEATTPESGTSDDLAGLAADAAASEPTAEPVAAEPAVAEPAVQAAAAAPAVESTVPAGWYADPSGRFELRYWDGTAWTEHVSRAGQQFTDPPVA